MSFDYESAKARVLAELTELTEELLLDVGPIYEKHHWRVPEDKPWAIYHNSLRVKDKQKRLKFLMLYELSINCYWHADDNFPEIRKNLTKEDEIFYANLMVEQAKRGHEKGRLGYAWIVKSYDNENLRDFISEDLLKEAINIGFWEIANEYFTDTTVSVPTEYYDTLMKYSEHLDLTRFNEFKTKPLVERAHCMPDAKYIAAFERARKKLDGESGGWLARPILDKIISWAFSLHPPRNNPEADLIRESENYKEYFSTKIIQELLKENVKLFIDCIGGDDSYFYLQFTKILAKHLNLTKPELVEFISSNLPIDEARIEGALVDINFPKDWLNPATLSRIKNKIKKSLDEPPPSWKREVKEIIPNLGFLQKTIRKSWLSKRYGKRRIKNKLEAYLNQKRRPAGASVVSLLNILQSDLVEQELYREAVHRGIADLVKRNRIKEASTWYRKAEKEGWLDKSKIPEFELQPPTAKNVEKENLKRATIQKKLF